ncbi:MAG: alpha/beta hydrolase [Deltaproteobacteria bacterium]|nr:alpha/beta hydrolase [Deltaproteobacteria bacterium]
MTLDDWYAGDRRESVRLASGPWNVFTRIEGAGGWCTLFHGFPTSSWDWHRVWPTLVARRRVLAFDFLGFGDSDKPADHDYTLIEQADLAIALWQRHGVTRTDLVVHDYGVSVAEEILARHAEGGLGVELASVTFLNGGIYPDLHRPQPSQVMLLDPEQGPKMAELVTAETFAMALRPTYAPTRQPSDADFADAWATVARRDGHRIGHRLIQYIRDRERHAARWVRALETTTVPRHFLWGMLDPVSGAHMAARIEERLSDRADVELVRLDDVAHWPELEAPEVIARHLERILA